MPRKVSKGEAGAAPPGRRSEAEAPAAVSLDAILYNRPGHLIRRLQQIAVSIFLDEVGDDLTPVQYGALAAIRANPGTDQITLAQAIGFDRTTIGGVIDRLEARGLVSRITPPGDRRIRNLLLTQEGEALLRAAFPKTEQAQERIVEPLTLDERKQFVDMLARVVWHHNATTRVPVRRSTAKPGSKGGVPQVNSINKTKGRKRES